MAGYSTKSLADKLGLKVDTKVAVIKAPPNYDELIGQWPMGTSISRQLRGNYDFIHYFVRQQNTLKAALPSLKQHLNKAGMLWVSWPKLKSGDITDLNENIIREHGLKCGLVDVKVAAVDETWSALKFVYRVKDR